MTTIIYHCEQNDLTLEQKLQLMKIYEEKRIDNQYEPGDILPQNAICFSNMPHKIARMLDPDARFTVHIDEALELLDPFETSESTVTDVIIPIDQLPKPHEHGFTLEQCLSMALANIEQQLYNDTPEYMKGDLRCMQRLLSDVQRACSGLQDDGFIDAQARKNTCASVMRELVRNEMAIFQDVITGKFHDTRTGKQTIQREVSHV